MTITKTQLDTWEQEVADLRAENTKLKAENARLRAEHSKLTEEAKPKANPWKFPRRWIGKIR